MDRHTCTTSGRACEMRSRLPGKSSAHWLRLHVATVYSLVFTVFKRPAFARLSIGAGEGAPPAGRLKRDDARLTVEEI